ncbi:MAG: pyrrolysine--tRNA(Pyl) ligase large subunit [Desulfosarcina sp.]|jgi:phenylalanyl-tRNA synthetase alpha chain
MKLDWTKTQRIRLLELGADAATLARTFDNADHRHREFQAVVKQRTSDLHRRLADLRQKFRRPRLCRLESALADRLVSIGFVQVSTPVLMSRGLLAKMGITADHPLFKQIYWVETDKCLRPMLAPHLYYVIKDLLRLWEKPVGIFEVGPCFRKETQGTRHAAEFTMLNLCEFGLPANDRRLRLEGLAGLIMAAAGIHDYTLTEVPSAVYESTVDVVGKDGLELGSGAMGPHPLDRPWRITEPWVGIGFGLERMLMAAQGGGHLARFGRSITYLDGVRLNI